MFNKAISSIALDCSKINNLTFIIYQQTQFSIFYAHFEAGHPKHFWEFPNYCIWKYIFFLQIKFVNSNNFSDMIKIYYVFISIYIYIQCYHIRKFKVSLIPKCSQTVNHV